MPSPPRAARYQLQSPGPFASAGARALLALIEARRRGVVLSRLTVDSLDSMSADPM